ncbi:MAG: AAA family ATPase, partial [Anaerolineae bacterium]|nr:AAA family ATPase [Anaerolineae bacterium]
MRRLVISLLGTFTVELDGEPVTEFGYDKVRALLAYLAVEGRRPQRRDTVVGLLWPEQRQSKALNNLRTALFHLRRALCDRGADPPCLLITRDSLQLNPDAAVEVDATRFAHLASHSQLHAHERGYECPDCVRAMNEAIALYHGDLLPGFSIDSAPFEEWLMLQREVLHDNALDLLDRLAVHEEVQGAYGRVVAHARRQIALEPWHEPAHRQAMRALALSGQRAAAVAQFETCREVLMRELGVGPEPATVTLYEQLLSGELLRPSPAGHLDHGWHHVGSCPYRGLATFREADAHLFFGRDAFVDQLLHALTTAQRVAVLVGPSGSGKSSIVFAGLIPRLRDLGGWVTASLRPGSEPFRALAGAITPLLAPSAGEAGRLAQTRTLAHALEADTIPLTDLVARCLPQQADSAHLLLLVDQFEELYTLCPNLDTRVRFIDRLLDATTGSRPNSRGVAPLTLLLTLRADFMGQALTHRPLADVLQAATQMLGPMTPKELREAIEKPAAAHGAVFEAGLVSRLLSDVEAAPEGLPLLEFALTLLWHRLDRGWLTHAAYDAIGQVQGALARYAQQVYEALTADEQVLACRVFTQLVQPGEGTGDTRRVASRADVGEAAWPLVRHMANQRLVVTGRDELTGAEKVEVAHEALIQHW